MNKRGSSHNMWCKRTDASGIKMPNFYESVAKESFLMYNIYLE